MQLNYFSKNHETVLVKDLSWSFSGGQVQAGGVKWCSFCVLLSGLENPGTECEQ